jgi:uncharacterized membrane protein YbhN (UPF0104 family)
LVCRRCDSMSAMTGELGGGRVFRNRKWVRPGLRVLAGMVVAAVSIGLLLWVAPPAGVIEQIRRMSPAWVLVAVVLELGSCLSYVVVFRRFFPEPPRAVSRQVAWIAMGAGAVLPGGNISSAAATGWLLRAHGIGMRRLLERCAALLCLLTAFGFFVNGVAGGLLLAGFPGGPHDLLHTGVPILVSAGVLSSAALVVGVTRRFADRGGAAPRLVRGVAAGLEGAWKAVGVPHWRLLGAAGFLLLDMGALWAACAATGHPLGFAAVVIAYCIGYLATAIPMPAGLAVLVYHAIAIWVPGLGGLVAWLPTRRERVGRPAVELPALGALRLAEVAETDG